MGFMLLHNPDQPSAFNKFTFLSGVTACRYMLFVFACLISLFANCQKFPVSAIPDSLKENAAMVIRLEEKFYEIKSTGQAVLHERHVFTILNEKGDGYAKYKTRYNNKSIIINNVNGYLYDATGKEVRHFKKKDMEDQPLYDGSSFVNDERVKVGELYSSSYPYTVEFEEEDELTELIQITDWYPQNNLRYSVERSVYRITAPADYVIRYKMVNSAITPVVEAVNNRKSYTWEIRNLIAMEESPYANYLMYVPHLMIGLSNVEMGGYKGSMSTWNDYAMFYGSLQKGRDLLPEDTKQKVHELTNGITSPQTKVALLYNYLQQNSHYVGIQLGIGGWQTYDAVYVAKNKYGDCKALSNFMISLLKEAGIKAHAVVIKGGDDYIDFVTDFTHDPFNHVICCVPLEKDTIWLECTDQFLPPGYLSEFTSNRYGLFIDENGGRLVHTPAYLQADNIQVRIISAALDNSGNLNLEARTSYKALCQDEIEKIIHHESKEDQLTRLKSEFNLPTYDVLSFKYQEDYSGRLPVINEDLILNVNNYAQVSGKRIFVNPNILSRSTEKLAEDKKRRLDIEIRDEYQYIDSVQISIPSGYEVESMVKDLELQSKFGKYRRITTVNPGKIVFTRIRNQSSGRFPAKDYPEIEKFYNDIYEADHTSIVLVRKD
jgi:transglutaminase-like putative cysteine protease